MAKRTNRHLGTASLCSLAVFLSLFLGRPFFGSSVLRSLNERGAQNEAVAAPDHFNRSRDDFAAEPPPQSTLSRTRYRPAKTHCLYRRDVAVDWTAAVSKGQQLLCLMNANLQDAQDQVKTSEKWKNLPIQSPFSNPVALQQWGWELEIDGQSVDIGYDIDINNDILWEVMVTKLGLSVVEADWITESVDHNNDWEVDGRSGPATEAYFIFKINKDLNNPALVLARLEYLVPTLEEKTDEGELPADSLPADLQKFSDVVFLTYYHAGLKWLNWPNVDSNGGSKIPAPKHIIIPAINTPEVVALLDELFRRYPTPWALTPGGVTWDANSEVGRMIIGTVHGVAVSFFLLQHKVQFGIKNVRAVTVWRTAKEPSWYNLYFEIGDFVETHLQKQAKARL